MRLKIVAVVLIFTSILSGALRAEHVDETKAKKAALNHYRYYAPASKQQASIIKVKEYKWGARTSFYICSFDKGGFVLVSANDAVTPVLGYGFEHGMPDEITNDAVKSWFDGYARQIDTAFVLNLRSNEASSKWGELLNNSFPKTQRSIVEPLLKTTWDQGWPYNAMCPTNPSGSGGHCYTGCVATAYGQILKYYNYPEKGSNEISYTDINGHQVSANFGSTYYNWDEMPASLPNIDTAYTATAELLFHCGVAAFSNYYPTATSGYYVEEPLLNIFDYAYSNLIWVQRASTLPDDWDNILINELISERPVYYSGSGPDGGHAFVCDGYDGSDYFHFNVGWGGQANGYYLTSALDFSGLTFNDSQRILIGIEPNDGSNVANDTILSGYNHFNSSMYVNATSTVTIMPGSTLVFDSACFFKIGGNFMSKGTDESPIEITAFDTINRWGGLKIHRTFFYLINGIETDTLLIENSNISFSENNGIYYNGGESNIAYDSTISEGLNLIKAHVFKNTEFGINTEFCKVYIDSCIIENNGGGFKLVIGWSEVKNSSFQYNTNYGVYIQNQLNFCKQPSFVSNCNISHNSNTETQLTGGIYFAPGSYFAPEPVGSKSLIQQNIISYNTGNPGGMRVHGYVDISRNEIYNNVSSFYGGGAMIADGARLVNNEIYNNGANYGGGGVSVSYGTIVNNLIYNNNSGVAGIALVDASILNNTIANNGSGISFIGFGSMEIKNNILWNSGVEIDAGDDLIHLSNSIINGGTNNISSTDTLSTIQNVINQIPNFTNSTNFFGNGTIPQDVDWSLMLNSPAIDAASLDTTGLVLPQDDTYGFPRMNRRLDIGAIENQSDTIHPCFIEDGYTLYDSLNSQVFLTIPYRGENCQFEWFHNNSLNLGVNNDTLFINGLSAADSGNYFSVISNTFGRDTSGICRIELVLPILNITCYLEGCFDETNSIMTSSLSEDDLLPLSQSYNQSPWNYDGTEMASAIPDSIVDWILVEIRDAISPEEATPSTTLPDWPKALFLKQDGSDIFNKVKNLWNNRKSSAFHSDG